MEHRFAGINDALPELAQHLLRHGQSTGSRNGRTLELLYPHIVFTRPLSRECVLPERAASLPALIAETAWVLAGRNDIEWLSHYLPRAADFSDDGTTWQGGYGPSLRKWYRDDYIDGPFVDQLAHVIDVLQNDSESRRAVISLYDPARDSASLTGKDVPCNNWLHFLARDGKLNLHVVARSNDFMWGWSGINAFQWSVLLEVVAQLAGLYVGELHFSISSFHVYSPYVQKTGRIMLADPLYPEPSAARFDLHSLSALDHQLDLFFQAEKALRVDGQAIETAITDPMLLEWLEVLRWWWIGDVELTGPGKRAAELSPGRPVKVLQPELPKVVSVGGVPTGQHMTFAMGQTEPIRVQPGDTTVATFKGYVTALHVEKDAAYGDSWKRRGEAGILGNISRKVDRLGGGTTRDETSADTAIDLLVYLAKYRVWLVDQEMHGVRSDTPEEANLCIRRLDDRFWSGQATDWIVDRCRRDFALVEDIVTNGPRNDLLRSVTDLQTLAFTLAYRLWVAEQ